MKSIISGLFLLFNLLVFSQNTISTESIRLCLWEGRAQKFNCGERKSDNSLLYINKNETIIKLTNNHASTTYYVQSSTHIESGYIFEVMSEDMTKYQVIVDFKHNELKILGHDARGQFMLAYGIKSIH